VPPRWISHFKFNWDLCVCIRSSSNYVVCTHSSEYVTADELFLASQTEVTEVSCLLCKMIYSLINSTDAKALNRDDPIRITYSENSSGVHLRHIFGRAVYIPSLAVATRHPSFSVRSGCVFPPISPVSICICGTVNTLRSR